MSITHIITFIANSKHWTKHMITLLLGFLATTLIGWRTRGKDAAPDA